MLHGADIKDLAQEPIKVKEIDFTIWKINQNIEYTDHW